MTTTTDPYPVTPRGPLDAVVHVPGSKSLTNRALLVTALARGPSRLLGALDCDDTRAMRDCLEALGIRVESAGDSWTVHGLGGVLNAPTSPLDVRASGTTARFIAAAATLASGPVQIDGSPRMRERPIQDLADALATLGAKLTVLGRAGCPPLRVEGGGLPGGEATIDARRSSQYVSAVLLVAPYAREDVTLHLQDDVLVSRPYVALTLEVMASFGAQACFVDEATLRVEVAHPYQPRSYAIEPDASSAAYPLAAAAIAGGRVRVEGLAADSGQADVQILDALECMGCSVTREGTAVEVCRDDPSRPLRALDFDFESMPDAALALAVVALFADGPSVLRGLGTLRIKETDRLAALETEIRRLGAQAQAEGDCLRVEPKPLHGATIKTYDDHRMAMAFALAGLRVPGVAIADPCCVEKTWPDYFTALERL